jgi:hypothetical protein
MQGITKVIYIVELSLLCYIESDRRGQGKVVSVRSSEAFVAIK